MHWFSLVCCASFVEWPPGTHLCADNEINILALCGRLAYCTPGTEPHLWDNRMRTRSQLQLRWDPSEQEAETGTLSRGAIGQQCRQLHTCSMTSHLWVPVGSWLIHQKVSLSLLKISVYYFRYLLANVCFNSCHGVSSTEVTVNYRSDVWLENMMGVT